jgi:hypothetical protein
MAEFEQRIPVTYDALVFCDMITGPTGQRSILRIGYAKFASGTVHDMR